MNDESKKWPIPMIIAACLYMLLGCIFLFQLRGNLDSLNSWFNCTCLVIGVGLWTRQNWARWLGIVWSALFFVKGMIKIGQEQEFNRQSIILVIWCIFFLSLIAILYKYPFKNVETLPNIPESEDLGC